MAHECPYCGQECYCDCDDTGGGSVHVGLEHLLLGEGEDAAVAAALADFSTHKSALALDLTEASALAAAIDPRYSCLKWKLSANEHADRLRQGDKMMITVVVLGYIACGVLAWGTTLGYFCGSCSDSGDSTRGYYGVAGFTALCGPFGLVVSALVSNFWQYGLVWK